MESKFTSKAIKIFNEPVFRLCFFGMLALAAFLLFIGEDPLNKKLHPSMAYIRSEWDLAYILEQNMQAVGTWFYACVSLGFTRLLFEFFPIKNNTTTNLFYFIFVSAAVFRAISFCDILDRSQGEYEFKGTIDKLIMLGSLVLAMNQYYKIKHSGLQKTT